ncbi:hypothetical protein Vretifemale_16813, partial [Volvox reticuliferus]
SSPVRIVKCVIDPVQHGVLHQQAAPTATTATATTATAATATAATATAATGTGTAGAATAAAAVTAAVTAMPGCSTCRRPMRPRCPLMTATAATAMDGTAGATVDLLSPVHIRCSRCRQQL